MPISAKHPDYIDREEEWLHIRHANRGLTAIRKEGAKYLPMPSGFGAQPDGGIEMYRAYQLRARFPDIVAPMLRGMVGIIHRNEAQVEMPDALIPLWERCTLDGLPLEAFHRRITHELLMTARYGILTDVKPGEAQPHLSGYSTESIINWSGDRDFFMLDETGLVRNAYDWVERKQFRELRLDGGTYKQLVFDGDAEGQSGQEVAPSRRGAGGTLDEIPFVVATARDLSLRLEEPPLIGVARAALAMYQLDADYRHQLYNGGQETLFVMGAKELPTVIGAGVTHGLPMGGDAKYVGPTGTTIEAHRTAIEEAKADAASVGAQMFDRQSGDESGEALRLRFAAQTASLTTIAQTSAQALERSLRYAAVFMGLDPELVVVKPNLRFVDTVMTPEAARKLMELWTGRAISKLTLFENLQRGEIISNEREFEDEEELIEADAIDPPSPPPGGAVPPAIVPPGQVPPPPPEQA